MTFSGRGLKNIELKLEPAGSTPEITPTVGHRYFNTVLEQWMSYDSTRKKFLSEESVTIPFATVGSVVAGNYFSGTSGSLSSTNGFLAEFNGTIIGLGYTTQSTAGATLDIVGDGYTIVTHSFSSSLRKFSNSLDADFNQGQIIAVRNSSSGSVITNINGWIKFKWRA